jgi:uncharacterized membrane protein
MKNLFLVSFGVLLAGLIYIATLFINQNNEINEKQVQQNKQEKKEEIKKDNNQNFDSNKEVDTNTVIKEISNLKFGSGSGLIEFDALLFSNIDGYAIQ